ncbi:hypothetical protein [Haloarcula litorea]|uniref:hypothetical protein n=1 Tax=Haloarcula litorea TaxID=3032579 RepID=UPI0023E8FA3C|nr:hypothetical protein [Halomicroarcula sp. GDY20]
MRRIYESDAIARDDDDSFAPNERDDDYSPSAMRSLPSSSLSGLLLPTRLRHRALSVTVETPASTYGVGEEIPIRVTLRNRYPFPVVLRTPTPRLWNWHVDGAPEASRVPEAVPEEPREFTFDRSERKQFHRRWRQLFKVTDREWEDAAPGEYTIGAYLDVDDPEEKGLADETTVRIER